MGKKRTRAGRKADRAKLQFHDWLGNSLDRIKAATTEKHKGYVMIDKIATYFNLSDIDLQEFRQKMKEREIQDFEEMKKEAQTMEKEKGKIIWTRDEKGNIVSPFSSKGNDSKIKKI